MNLLYASGTATPAGPGCTSRDGQITFARGQIFPGTGAITGVTAGADLTGGGNSGNVTLNLDTTQVPQLNAIYNDFTGDQFVNGTVEVRQSFGNTAAIFATDSSSTGESTIGVAAAVSSSGDYSAGVLVPQTLAVA